jgi:hypothetical protein
MRLNVCEMFTYLSNFYNFWPCTIIGSPCNPDLSGLLQISRTPGLGGMMKLEATRLVWERDISIVQGARDLDLHENVLRK